MSKALHHRAPIQHQRGISLLVVLLLLVVMSILGIAVLRSAAMQERMRANMLERNDAKQASETGLRIALKNVIRGNFNDMWVGRKDCTTLRGTMTCGADGYCDRSVQANAAT